MAIVPTVQLTQISKGFLLQLYQNTGQHLLVSNRIPFQTIRHHIIYILHENDIGLQIIQIFDKRTVPAGAEQKLTVHTERFIVHRGRQSIRGRFLFGECDMERHPVCSFIHRKLFFHQCLEQSFVLRTHRKMNFSLSFAGSIQSRFYQMFLQRSARTVLIPVKRKQSFRQLAVIQTFRTKHVRHNLFILAGCHQTVNPATFIFHANRIQFIVECKITNRRKKSFFEISGRHIVFRIQKFKHILKHTAGRARSRNKLAYRFSFFLISLPHFLIMPAFFCRRSQNTMSQRSGRFQLQKWKSFLKSLQLSLYLLFRNPLSGQ